MAGFLLTTFLLIAVLSCFRTKRLTLGSATLVRLLVPSWRFYEEVGEVPELLYRTGSDPQKLGAWKPCLSPPKRGLVLNSRENLFTACQGMVGQLVCEISEWEGPSAEDLLDSVPYQLVQNLVREHIAHKEGWFQFKVRPKMPQKPSPDFLLSAVHKL